MEWSELLLVLLFVVLPLLQQLLERRGPKRPPTEEELEALEEYEGAIEPERSVPALPHAETAGELARREVLDEEAARELAALQRRLPPETVPEAVRVSAPVVSTEAPGTSRRSRRTPRTDPLPAAEPPRSRSAPRVEPLLRGREELRRAVLLSEILGPPKSLE